MPKLSLEPRKRLKVLAEDEEFKNGSRQPFFNPSA